MSKKIKNFLIIFLCTLIVGYGFLMVSSSLPKFIKDNSAVKINFNPQKVDLSIESGEYVFYFNNRIVSNLAEKTTEVFRNLGNNFINKAN
jgi:hypothetical protein